MGAVYAAFDLREWRLVALKKIEPLSGSSSEMFEERFEREIRALAGIKHPGVPMLYASGRSPEGVAYYTMEIIAGERLRRLLEGGALEPVRALTIAIELGRALAAAHEAGVVHRDVKPGNVLLEPGGRVRVIDFGACSFLPHFFLREEIGAERITATCDRWATSDFDVVASLGYSAPEISRHDEAPTARADIYSVCAILYEMIQGRSLFDQQAHCDRVISPDEFAPRLAPLAGILARGAAHETYDRQKSMSELVQALEILRTSVSDAGAPQRPKFVVAPKRRSWWVSAGMGVGAAALLALAFHGEGAPPRDAVEQPPAVAESEPPEELASPIRLPPPAPAESEAAEAHSSATISPPPALAERDAADIEQSPPAVALAPGAANDRTLAATAREVRPEVGRRARTRSPASSGAPPLIEAKLVSAVRACDPESPPRVALQVKAGTAEILTINSNLLDPDDAIHRCVRDELASQVFAQTDRPVRLILR